MPYQALTINFHAFADGYKTVIYDWTKIGNREIQLELARFLRGRLVETAKPPLLPPRVGVFDNPLSIASTSHFPPSLIKKRSLEEPSKE
jgi:hypothetical protein